MTHPFKTFVLKYISMPIFIVINGVLILKKYQNLHENRDLKIDKGKSNKTSTELFIYREDLLCTPSLPSYSNRFVLFFCQFPFTLDNSLIL